MGINVKRLSQSCLEVRIPYTSEKEEFQFLLASDLHIDNPKCDRQLLFKHLEEARTTRRARVFLFGDVMCLMQGRHDKRGGKSSIREEHQGANYFDLVFEDTANLLGPYGKMILLIAAGNHETKILQVNEIDPTANVVQRMRDRFGAITEAFGYQGWVRFIFHRDGGRIRSCNLFFHHGAWGGIVTKGTMGGGRYGLIAPDAQILINGHNHEQTMVAHPCYRLRQNGEVRLEKRWHIQTGTYKNEFGGDGGWAVERIVVPKPLGGVWLKLRPEDSGVAIACEAAC